MLDRRQFNGATLLVLGLGTSRAWGLDLSNADAAAGLRAALERGAASAVDLLGKPDGFLGNPKVRIPLPKWLDKSQKLLTLAGYGDQVEELKVSMNRAAEAAVPEAKALLVAAVKKLTVKDAQRILGGGDTAVTEFFAEKTRAPLGERFLPIVTRATEKVGAARRYNTLAAKASSLGLVKGDDANVQRYVTGKALDGLYAMIGEEEQRIRQDPVGTGSAILKKVFGAL